MENGQGASPFRAASDFADEEKGDRLRRPSDLIQLLLSAAGVLLTLGLELYLPRTVNGLDDDLRQLLDVSGPLLSLPLNALGSIAVLIPLITLVELLIRRALHHVGAGILAAAAGVVVSFGVRLLLEQTAPDRLLNALTVVAPAGQNSPILSHSVAFVALLTALGPRRNLSTLNVAWVALLLSLGFSVFGNRLALGAALLTFFVGRLVGLTVRMLRGFKDHRGAGLVQAMRAAGLAPSRIHRVPLGMDAGQPYAWQSPRSYGLRLYRVEETNGRRLDLAVLDEDSRIRGSFVELWRAVRIREAMRRQARISLRQTAEKDALILTMAAATGARVPQLITIADVGLSSVLLATESTPTMYALGQRDDDTVTDAQLDDIWHQLHKLHAGNVAHRSLSRETVCFDDDGNVWLRGLQEGEVAASPLAKQLDLAQLLTALATVVGSQRAVESGVRCIGRRTVIRALPVLQPLVIPGSTRRILRRDTTILPELRAAITALVPEAQTEPEQVSRFSTRKIVAIAAGALAAYLLAIQVADINFADLLETANPWWAVVALALSLTTYLGTAMSLHGVAPVKLRYWRSVLVQIGASFTALITPAGVGAPALNARYLQQAGVRTPIAVTSMGLLQISMLAVMGLVVLALAVASGFSAGATGTDTFELVPVPVAIAVVLGLLALATTSLLIPSVRKFTQRQWSALVTGTLPRMLDVLTQPRRLVLTLGGIVLSNAAYVLTFAACLAAFGASIDAIHLVIVYLIGNLLGSIVPTPGGLGAVESSLVLGLTATGVDAAVALSAVLLFRLISFWLRVPFGWTAIRFLTKRGHL
ncbi:lysylphosphatidylglycerol synthase transmembrane domain-containing protein [Arthrobacter roseus]